MSTPSRITLHRKANPFQSEAEGCIYDSIFGEFALIWDESALRYHLPLKRLPANLNWHLVNPPLKWQPVLDYLESGPDSKQSRPQFSISKSCGTVFQRSVWEGIRDYAREECLSYGQLSRLLGLAKSVRAVASACAANPLWLLIPCHRIVAGDGMLTGYAGGLAMKRALLELEGFPCSENRLVSPPHSREMSFAQTAVDDQSHRAIIQ